MKPNPSNLCLRVLHLDDDPFELERVARSLVQSPVAVSFAVESFGSTQLLRERLTQAPDADLAILDIHLGQQSEGGISFALEARRRQKDLVILMCSSADDAATIAECLAAGADDFISKRSDRGELSLRVYHSYRLARLKQGLPVPSDGQVKPPSRGAPAVIGATLERIARRIPLIVNSAVSAVHITGESGTGKEVVADLFASYFAKDLPFIKVNCGAIAPTLLEGELFGHVKGTFTGAVADKKGLFEAASGGWIFLDEVATLSPSAQVALLRVLENQEVTRVGDTKARPISIRVLSATNESLKTLVERGKFRLDLWQRLCETEINLPPLRERPGEIEKLVAHFCATMPGGPFEVSGSALEVLASAPWQLGNIRELRNCLRAMTEFQVDKLLTPLAIPERIWEQLGSQEHSPTEPFSSATGNTMSQDAILLPWDVRAPVPFDSLADQLLLAMTKRLASQHGKLSLRALARGVGIPRSTLSTRLKSLVHKNLVSLAELTELVGVSDKTED